MSIQPEPSQPHPPLVPHQDPHATHPTQANEHLPQRVQTLVDQFHEPVPPEHREASDMFKTLAQYLAHSSDHPEKLLAELLRLRQHTLGEG